MKSYPLLLILCLGGFALPLQAQDALSKLKGDYQASQTTILHTHSTEADKLETGVVGALTKGMDTARKAGNLDLVNAYQSEIDRWKLADHPDTAESMNAEIQKIYGIYRSASAKRKLDMQRELLAWNRSYQEKLTALEKSLVVANKIP